MEQLDLLPETVCDLKHIDWLPSRDAGLARLADFVPAAGRQYAGRRNFDFGSDDRSNISCLSPWIRHRLISEEEVLAATLERHMLQSAEKFVQEVFWRSYFKGWLQHHPTVWSDYRYATRALHDQLTGDAVLRARYETAVSGQTKIACFDHWATELVETGYLHNHARMWFASIWVFTLKLPWQLGADFFFRHLLDGDPASNTLSWRWVGGLHTKGKTYLARADNIEKYTAGRFNPTSQLSGQAVALVEDSLHTPMPLPIGQQATVGKRHGLLITEEDCLPETLLPDDIGPIAILGAAAVSNRSANGADSKVIEFTHAAIGDALDRAAGKWVRTSHADSSVSELTPQLLADFAAQNRLDEVVTAIAPIGPVAEVLTAARPVLERQGVRLVEIQRDHDRLTWPHADRGFFKLKRKIPNLLSRLGLS